ncbi:hypothetical protein JR316_0003842 [Psilocybe cubensis]|uniref:Uncharacterized protein n=1 Tax=Psilocybe cubensis TaxID=181762 RepID=A0ACB8HA58_PSICU|nr:hypothetical protein JR316_0003842 [Psilocybe cubensis]KAH9484361.1 hypothetical protein JR316_0003842 [Psilocybe cubensis]
MHSRRGQFEEANLQHSGLAPSEWHILDDGTGRIKAFIGKNKDPTYVYDKFEYVRVVGTLEFGVRGEKRSLSVFNMAPVHDPYEVYYHINHAMVDTMICERGSPPYNLIPDTHGQDIESLSQAFQNTSFSDVTEPHMAQQSVQEPNRQYDRVPFRSLLERDIIALIDRANLVYLEDLVMFIRQSCPTVDSAALKEAIQYLLSENLIEAGEDSGRDYFQLGERITGRN